jgi:protein-S-isoprenylcysteine O-methyltransferase Ste14
MIIVRAILVAGMLLHKVVWEVWKRQEGATISHASVPVSPVKRIMKSAKAAFLVFLMLQAAFLNVLPIPGRSSGRRIAGLALFVAGVGMAIAGRLQLGSNWSNIEDGQIRTDQALETRGIYRVVRHPIYAGDSLLLFGLELALNSWLVLAMFGPLIMFIRRALAEEAMLTEAFPDYASYRKRTWRFIPFLRKG